MNLYTAVKNKSFGGGGGGFLYGMLARQFCKLCWQVCKFVVVHFTFHILGSFKIKFNLKFDHIVSVGNLLCLGVSIFNNMNHIHDNFRAIT